MESKLFNLSLSLKVIVGISIILWAFIALFPLLWVFIMSIKLPIDSFAANPLNVIIGPNTLKQVGGLSFINLIFLCFSRTPIIGLVAGVLAFSSTVIYNQII